MASTVAFVPAPTVAACRRQTATAALSTPASSTVLCCASAQRQRSRVVAVAKRVRARRRNEDNDLVGQNDNAPWATSGGSSRFPENWGKAMEQAGQATVKALRCGEVRVLVELAPPVRPMQLLEKLIEPMVLEDDLRVKVFFDTINEAVDATPDLPPRLREHVQLSFLGDAADMSHSDVAILFQPNNIDGTPLKIEEVEHLHYRLCWNEPRPVIMVNPRLMSLGCGLDALGERRAPMFMEDYRPSYCLNARAFSDGYIQGATLLQYPRTWEMYTFRAPGGFRLVHVSRRRPTKEQILVQFLWRSDLARNLPRGGGGGAGGAADSGGAKEPLKGAAGGASNVDVTAARRGGGKRGKRGKRGGAAPPVNAAGGGGAARAVSEDAAASGSGDNAEASSRVRRSAAKKKSSTDAHLEGDP